MPDREAEKISAARRAVSYVNNGMRVGLGSGATAAHAVRLLGERIRTEGLQITGIPTSPATRELAIAAAIPLLPDTAPFQLDIAIDGADEATTAGELIKGAGGALLRERIVAAAAREFIVIGDGAKLVPQLGAVAVPVEIFAFGAHDTIHRLQALGCTASLRRKNEATFLTEEGNWIIDCHFAAFPSPGQLCLSLDSTPGVVDHGLFLGMAHRIIIANGNDITEFHPA